MNTRYQTPAPPATAEPWMVETRVPVGPSRVETHVIVPLLHATITMILLAAVVLLWQWHPLAGAVGTVGLLVWGWRILLGDRLAWKLETITGRDITGDGQVGRPGALGLINPQAARQEVAQQETQTSDLPRMNAFVVRCFIDGTPEAKQRIRPNTKERTNYVECRDGLLRLGLARWRNEENHDSGWDMVLDREQTLAIIAQHVR